MLGLSIGDAVAVVTLLSGLALTAAAVRKNARTAPPSAADMLASLPQVHPTDTLVRTLKSIVDASRAGTAGIEKLVAAEKDTSHQIKRLADAFDAYRQDLHVEREIGERLAGRIRAEQGRADNG